MTPQKTLTVIFLRQMKQSKALWIIFGIALFIIIYDFYSQSRIKESMAMGMSYDVATRQAVGKIREFSDELKNYMVILVFVASALVAPASRKNGTTQFVLSLHVSRMKLALAQFTALSIYVTAAVLIIHTGFGVMAIKTGFIGIPDLLFGWIPLLMTLLMVSVVSFCLSLNLSSISVYLIFLFIPGSLSAIRREYFTTTWGAATPVPIARMIDNLIFLFPSPDSFLYWPFANPGLRVLGPPYPLWFWPITSFVFITLFWVSLSYCFYRKMNIGSRQVLK
jgi:hypothetical protein